MMVALLAIIVFLAIFVLMDTQLLHKIHLIFRKIKCLFVQNVLITVNIVIQIYLRILLFAHIVLTVIDLIRPLTIVLK